jgi:hypothetical protein
MIIYSLSFSKDLPNVDGILLLDEMKFVGKLDFCIYRHSGILCFRLYPTPHNWYWHRWLNISPLRGVVNRLVEGIPAGTELSVLQYDEEYYVNLETRDCNARLIYKSYIDLEGLFIDIGGEERLRIL